MDYLKIGEVAQLLNMSVSGIRTWEEKGIIKAVRTATGQRRFRREDVEKLRPKEATSA